MSNSPGFISLFARHKVAATLLMLLMMLVGLWSLFRINVQFLPNYNLNLANITIIWNGASAEDVENSITIPLEKELRDLDFLKEMTSTSKNSSSVITLEFEQGTDMSSAIEEVRQRVSQVRNLPQDSEKPIISEVIPYEPVAKLVITGPKNLAELRPLVHQFERELLDKGIAKVEIVGLPEQEIAIQIPSQTLVDLQLALPQIAARIALRSRDFPAGTIGKSEVGRQLRSLEQRRDIQSFARLPILSDAKTQLVRLGDIAHIEQRSQDREVRIYYKGNPAIEMHLLRTENANALRSAKIVHQWLNQIRPTLGQSLSIHVYDENWQYIQERINLLLRNGAGGLMLILLVLFLMLDKRVAFWVAMGIPASFLAAIAFLYLLGGSINMVSLFAFIMSLGIIVDDTIVVGEQALTNLHAGQKPLQAVVSAAHKMMIPVFASSLTTICAFLPLLFISGIMGSIIFDIPLVVIFVILASLLECFLVLPGHLLHSYSNLPEAQQTHTGKTIHHRFAYFRDHLFRPVIILAIRYRAATITLSFAIFVFCMSLIALGYINFSFFPAPEGRLLIANIQFNVGTPPTQVHHFLQQVEAALYQANKKLSPPNKSLLQVATATQNLVRFNRQRLSQGEQYASITAELTSPDSRSVTNKMFIKQWQANVKLPPGIENFTIFAPRGGPPGEDIDLELSGHDVNHLKNAATELKTVLASFAGVSDIRDNLPYGQEQIVFQLTQTGESIGLTTDGLGRQLRAAFNGLIAQIFHLPNEEIEVRVVLPDNERNSLTTLEQLPILTSQRKTVPLSTVATLGFRRAPDELLHTNSKLTVHVTAKVDHRVNNANKIIAALNQNTLPDLIKRYGLQLKLKGKAEEQSETLRDMRYGLLIALALIFIILAWVFSSYTWPLIVMTAIPLGLTGAILGHLIMGLNLTIMSLFGFFGLTGIVVNDSIILLSEYKHLKQAKLKTQAAIVTACSSRLRAVLLTSITTIAGLTPLLFETSLQAQFLIPMAVSISFGLAYATLLILIVIPCLLSLHEDAEQWIKRQLGKRRKVNHSS